MTYRKDQAEQALFKHYWKWHAMGDCTPLSKEALEAIAILSGESMAEAA